MVSVGLYDLLWAPESQATKAIGTQTFETHGLVAVDPTAPSMMMPVVEVPVNNFTFQAQLGFRSIGTQTEGFSFFSAPGLVTPTLPDCTPSSVSSISTPPPSVTSAPSHPVSPYSFRSTPPTSPNTMPSALNRTSEYSPRSVSPALYQISKSSSNSNPSVTRPVSTRVPPHAAHRIKCVAHIPTELMAGTGHVSLGISLSSMLEHINAVRSYTLTNRLGAEFCQHYVKWMVIPGSKPIKEYPMVAVGDHVSWIYYVKEKSRARCQALEKATGNRCQKYVHIMRPECCVILCVTHYHRSSRHNAGRSKDKRY